MKTQTAQQAAAAARTPMQPLSGTQVGQVAGGGISNPEMLTTPPPTSDQIISPDL
jgi:hypothetical protein